MFLGEHVVEIFLQEDKAVICQNSFSQIKHCGLSRKIEPVLKKLEVKKFNLSSICVQYTNYQFSVVNICVAMAFS